MPFLDLHAHFPMHLRFPHRPSGNPALEVSKAIGYRVANLALNYQAGRPRVTLRLAHRGRVSGFGSVLYSPADEFFQPRKPRPDAFDNLLAQMAEVETELSDDPSVAIARNPDEFERLLETGRTAVFHCVEGGHGLSGNPANVRRLAERGIAYITIAHLFYRGVATCANPFPHLPEKLFQVLNPQPRDLGLTPVGREIVERMFDEGVIVDITHCSVAAQSDVFEIAAHYPHQPIIASHIGVLGTSDSRLNLSDEAIRRIAASDGLVGITLSPYRLRRSSAQWIGRRDIRLVFDAIDHVAQVTGSYDSIGIGTDLDGFISPIREFKNYASASAFADLLGAHYGHHIGAQILTTNALRVLKRGWRGR